MGEHWTVEWSLFAVPGSNSGSNFHFLLQKRIAGSNPGSEWHFFSHIHPTCSLNWFSLFWLKKWTSLKPLLAENGRTLSNFLFCHLLFSNSSKKSRFLWILPLKVEIRFSYDIPHIIANYFMHLKLWKITMVLSCSFWDVCYKVRCKFFAQLLGHNSYYIVDLCLCTIIW